MQNNPILLKQFKNYQVVENETFKVLLLGKLIHKKSDTLLYELLETAKMLDSHQLDFNDILGFHKIIVWNKINNKYYFWGDNAGSQCFYYRSDFALISDSFLELKNSLTSLEEPNYESVFQLLEYNAVVTDETLVKQIKKTNSESYYQIYNGRIDRMDKNLHSLSSENNTISLDMYMKDIVSQFEKDTISAVVTGGTDSRTILSHLIYNGVKPRLILTGHNDNPDIPVAYKISSVLECPLKIVDFKPEGDWINEGYAFSDGVYDIVLSYRHYKKSIVSMNQGSTVEFGGVGGEFYKNSFCRPIRDGLIWRRNKNITGEFLFDKVFRSIGTNSQWYGDKLLNASIDARQRIIDIINRWNEKELLGKCNRVGQLLLRNKFSVITNNAASYCLKVDPLMEPRIISTVSKLHPLHLSMYIWQRKEIHTHCSELSEIENDTGYTCTTKSLNLLAERLQKLYFWISRILARMRKGFGVKYKDVTPRYWDEDYTAARDMPCFYDAIETCKKLGIVTPTATADNIPMNQTGNILLIGLVFGDI